MKCKECKYHNISNFDFNGNTYIIQSCKITNASNSKSCTYIKNDSEVKEMNICYNCKYWIGGGDWGLSCRKNYYNCNSNGFEKACEQFDRKSIY